ncbi:MAG: rod shape-determining protein MreD [Prevotella sp.]|nr:rod shape-determining protein MreD [Prevotella sp.]
MAIDTLKRLLVFVALVLAQALVLNRIQLFHCATPLLFVYFVIIFPRNYPRWASLLWSFFLGLTADMFANTPGVAAASLTLTGFLQPQLLELFLPREADENIKSSVSSLGFWRFAGLSAALIAVFCLMFFALELFSVSNWLYWLECAGGSALFTFVLIMALESLRGKGIDG